MKNINKKSVPKLEQHEKNDDSPIAKQRVIRLFSMLAEGRSFTRQEAAQQFGVSVRSIHRDLEELRTFFEDHRTEDGLQQQLICDKSKGGYTLVPPLRNLLTNEEVFAVLKILLESRALVKEEMEPIIKKLIDCCVPRPNQEFVRRMIGSERLNYVELQHHKKVLQPIWQLATAVKQRLVTKIDYTKKTGEKVSRNVKPVGIMFNEFYFYLIAFIISDKPEKQDDKNKYPAIYRIDRLDNYKVTDEHFAEEACHFEEGEFRKRVQFMFGGKLRKVKYSCKNDALEANLDKLPTATIIKKDKKRSIISAEVYGSGIEIWLRGQGDCVEILESKEFDI